MRGGVGQAHLEVIARAEAHQPVAGIDHMFGGVVEEILLRMLPAGPLPDLGHPFEIVKKTRRLKMALGNVMAAREPSFEVEVILIQKGDVVAARRIQPGVSSTTTAGVVLLDETDSAVAIGGDTNSVGSAVGRPVVNDDQFPVAVALT